MLKHSAIKIELLESTSPPAGDAFPSSHHRTITGDHSKQDHILSLKSAKSIGFCVYRRSYLIRPPVILVVYSRENNVLRGATNQESEVNCADKKPPPAAVAACRVGEAGAVSSHEAGNKKKTIRTARCRSMLLCTSEGLGGRAFTGTLRLEGAGPRGGEGRCIYKSAVPAPFSGRAHVVIRTHGEPLGRTPAHVHEPNLVLKRLTIISLGIVVIPGGTYG